MATDERVRCLRYRNVSSTTGCDPRMELHHLCPEQLITEVEKYPCLYAIHTLQYKDLLKKEESWAEIASLLNRNSADLKKEWKNLRDCYRQALVTRCNTRNDARRKALKPWKYENQMQFLKPYIWPRSRHLDGAYSMSTESEFGLFAVKQEVMSEDDDELVHFNNPVRSPLTTAGGRSDVETRIRILRNRDPRCPPARFTTVPWPPKEAAGCKKRKRKDKDSQAKAPKVSTTTASNSGKGKQKDKAEEESQESNAGNESQEGNAGKESQEGNTGKESQEGNAGKEGQEGNAGREGQEGNAGKESQVGNVENVSQKSNAGNASQMGDTVPPPTNIPDANIYNISTESSTSSQDKGSQEKNAKPPCFKISGDSADGQEFNAVPPAAGSSANSGREYNAVPPAAGTGANSGREFNVFPPSANYYGGGGQGYGAYQANMRGRGGQEYGAYPAYRGRVYNNYNNVLPSSVNILGNGGQDYNALQLFFASMYESAKKLPARYQGEIKRELLASIQKAEDANNATQVPVNCYVIQ